jgi:hypothetical protein
MRKKKCFFIGHREAPDTLLPALMIKIRECLELYGVTEFYVGHYGHFDALVASALIALKRDHPDMRLYLVIPYHPAEQPIRAPEGFDGTYYPPNMESVPKKLAIVRANTAMVDSCDYLIAYVTHPASNAAALLVYAQKKHIQVIHLNGREISL